MRVQKIEPRDVELLKANGFVISDDAESAEFSHSGDDGDLTLSIIRPAVGAKLLLTVGLPNGATITGAVTDLHSLFEPDDEQERVRAALHRMRQ